MLPIATYFLFELPGEAIALLYVEAISVILLYTVLAMVAKPESQLEEREKVVPAGPIKAIDRQFSERPWNITRWLPPVYPKNLRLVIPTGGLLMVLIIGAGGAVTVPGWGFGRRAGRRGEAGTPMDFFAQFSMFEIPVMAVIGLFIAVVHIFVFYRYYFATGNYRDWTAHMALETQIQYALLYAVMYLAFFFYAVVIFLILGFTLPAIMPRSIARTVVVAVLAGSFILVKRAFERSRFRGEQQPGLSDGSFTANFAPTPPSTEDSG